MASPKRFSVECSNYPMKFYVEEWLERRGHEIRDGGWRVRVEIAGEEVELLCYADDGKQVCSAHSSTLMLEDIRSSLIQLSKDRSGTGEIF